MILTSTVIPTPRTRAPIPDNVNTAPISEYRPNTPQIYATSIIADTIPGSLYLTIMNSITSATPIPPAKAVFAKAS